MRLELAKVLMAQGTKVEYFSLWEMPPNLYAADSMQKKLISKIPAVA